MASIIADASQTTAITRVSEGDNRQVRALRDGALVSADWYLALVAEGRVFGVNMGTASTPITVNAAYADAEQDLYIYVPAGTVIIPLYIGLNFEDTGTAAAADIFAAYSSNGDAATTGGVDLTIMNYKTLASPNSACVATQVVTGAGTTHLGGTDFLEFWRPYAGFQIDAFAPTAVAWLGGGSDSMHGMFWTAKEKVPPVIGSTGTDCAMSIFMGVTACIGWATVVWAELRASAVA